MIPTNKQKSMDEIKTWKVENYRTRACDYLMMRNMPFSFAEESGLVFTAPSLFVEKMVYDLKVSSGCAKIKITEVK